MPTFGDFETIGEPISVTEQSGHVSTVWRAHRTGSDTEVTHAIKCFAPHRRKAKEGEPDDALDKDRGLEFLEGVKQLKKVQAEGGRYLTPIHAFGFADEGAWYVTDFYQRNTLKAWIARRGSVDGPALRQVVFCIVTGCLALKRSRGYSHGNLKAANVFLVGKPQPLRKTPLALADAYPAAPLQLARLVGEEKRTVDDLLHQVMEVQDLRALGELLLQLVEGRLVASAYDYNYPIAASPAWERLGREAERWRELCNQLLDPRLSLEKLNLESLANEFRPSVATQKLPLIIGAAAGVILLGGGIFLLATMISKSGNRKFVASLQAATNAYAAGDWGRAQKEIESALRRKSTDAAALDWKNRINARIEQEYSAAVRSGRAALSTNVNEAANLLKRALELRPAGQDALELQSQISAAQSRLATEKEQQRKQLELSANYDAALKAGQKAFGDGDFKVAYDKAVEALGYQSGDAAATKLKNDADAQLKAQADSLAKYDAALKAGQTAYGRGEYQEAFNQAVAALSYKSGDPTATKLKNDSDSQLRSAADRLTKYQEALKAGQAAYNRGDYKEADSKATEALSYQAGDATATKLKNDADSQLKLAADRLAKYDAALKSGQGAFTRGEFKEAFDKAVEALSYKSGDETATKLKNDADSQLKSVADRLAKYDAALKAGQTAFDGGDFKVAYDKAVEAMSYKSGDEKATKLKNDADSQLKSAAERAAKYDAAFKASQTAFTAGQFKTAYDKAVEALSYRAGDAAATKLKNDADSQLKSAADRAAKYEAALKTGQTAFADGDFKLAADKATEALSYRTGDATATKLKEDADAQLKALADRATKLDAALKAGQTAFAAGEFKTAYDKAVEALGYQTNNATATKLRDEAEAQLKSLADRAAKFDQALKAGQTAFAGGEYKVAYDKAVEALTYRTGDATATKLKTDAEAQLLRAARQQNFDTAMAAAGTALDAAKAALASKNFAEVSAKISAGLKQCAIARTNGDAATVASLEQNFTALRTQAESVKAEADYAQAQGLLQAGKIPEALAICQGYTGNSKFEELGRTLGNMQRTFETAQASLKKGDYSYLNTVESGGYGKNPLFESLMVTGQRESKQLATLVKLKDAGQWKELSGGLDALKSDSREVWAKDSFQSLVKWVAENDPTKVLDNEILKLKIMLGVDTKTVMTDPSTGRRVQKLAPTVEVDGYHDVLDGIIKQLGGENSAAYKARKRDFDQIRSAINNWR